MSRAGPPPRRAGGGLRSSAPIALALVASTSCAGPLWFPSCPAAPKLRGDFSARERDVLQLMALGATNRQIARRLHLAPDTVKQHTSSVYRKLQARNRAAVVNRAQQIGLVG